MLAPLTLLLPLLPALVDAGSVNKGGACNITDNRLQVGTFAFFTDCNVHNFCDPSSGTCQLKKCRRDDFPFGYDNDDHLPPKCDSGQFCPDEEDECQAVMPVGSPCQLNRDDQCEGPPNWQQVADTTNRGLNFNGSMCLNNVCTYVNATDGQSCVLENTAYIGYGENGQEFIDIVSRGNCVPGYYCDAQSTKCKQTQQLGATCDADKECDSYNCGDSGKCARADDQPHDFPVYVYILVAAGIFGGIFGTLFGLFFLHRRQRDDNREKRLQYWREQTAFRNNIMQMREAARASLLSLPNNGMDSRRSSMRGSDDSQAPMLPHGAAKASGLRHYVSDDDASVDYDEGLVMQGRHGHDYKGPGYGRPF